MKLFALAMLAFGTFAALVPALSKAGRFRSRFRLDSGYRIGHGRGEIRIPAYCPISGDRTGGCRNGSCAVGRLPSRYYPVLRYVPVRCRGRSCRPHSIRRY